MSEDDPSNAPARAKGLKLLVMAAVGAVGAALALALPILQIFNQAIDLTGSILGKLHQPCSALGVCTGPRSDTNSPGPSATPAKRKTVEPLFVVALQGDEGAVIDTRTRRGLQAEGFRMASSREEAGLLIEIGPPLLGPVETSADSRLDIVTVTATLGARIMPGAGGGSAARFVRREVRGRGPAEADARRDAINRAADQLGGRIAAALP